MGISTTGGGVNVVDAPATMGSPGGDGVVSPIGSRGLTGSPVAIAVQTVVGLPNVPGGHTHLGL